MGRSFGIPQNVGSSEVIGELVLEPVVDRLARSGVVSFRRNDDFYLPASTWDDGISAIEQLQAELHSIGLTPNEEKTRVLKRDTLARNIARVSRRLTEILADRTLEAADIPEVDAYTGDAKASDGEDDAAPGIPPEDVIAAALELLEESLAEWRGVPLFEGQIRDEAADDPAVARSAVLAVIRLLGRLRSDAVLAHGVTILRTDPGMTQTYVLAYLRHLPPTDVDIPQHIESILDAIGTNAPAWQQAWLMDPLLDLETRPTERLGGWLHAFLLTRQPATLRMRALMVLGAHDLVEPVEITKFFDNVPLVARPDVAAAMALRVADVNDSAVRSIRRAGKLYDWIVQDVVDSLPDTSSL
jgi:hypothetical protein